MKNAAVILGIIGGVLGMITGFFAYGYVEFLGWFNSQVEQDVLSDPDNPNRIQILGILAPVMAIAGGAMAHPRPLAGAILLTLSVVGMVWGFGFGVFTMFPIVMTGLAALFACFGLMTKEPGTL